MPATLADIQRKYGIDVYPIYKERINEPYMENNTYHGYQGVVLFDKKEDKVLCSGCGNWFKQITSQHIKKCLKLKNINEYKDRFGLLRGTPLCSINYSSLRSKVAQKGLAEVNRRRKKEGWKPQFLYSKCNTNSEIRAKIQKKAKNKMQVKNNFNLCPAQITARLAIICKILNKQLENLTDRDVSKYDRTLLHTLSARYGSREEAIKKLNLQKMGRNNYQDVEIIARLRRWVVENRSLVVRQNPHHSQFGKWYIPQHLYRDSNGLVPLNTIRRYFGSLRRAWLLAGLDQLLEEGETVGI